MCAAGIRRRVSLVLHGTGVLRARYSSTNTSVAEITFGDIIFFTEICRSCSAFYVRHEGCWESPCRAKAGALEGVRERFRDME